MQMPNLFLLYSSGKDEFFILINDFEQTRTSVSINTLFIGAWGLVLYRMMQINEEFSLIMPQPTANNLSICLCMSNHD